MGDVSTSARGSCCKDIRTRGGRKRQPEVTRGRRDWPARVTSSNSASVDFLLLLLRLVRSFQPGRPQLFILPQKAPPPQSPRCILFFLDVGR